MQVTGVGRGLRGSGEEDGPKDGERKGEGCVGRRAKKKKKSSIYNLSFFLRKEEHPPY